MNQHPPALAPVTGNGVRDIPASMLPELIDAAERAGLRVARLALADTHDKPTLLALFAAAMAFPDGLGGNWDALADALGDLSWLDAGGHVLVLDGTADLEKADHEVLDTALDILAEAAAGWAMRGVAFQVFTCSEALPVTPG